MPASKLELRVQKFIDAIKENDDRFVEEKLDLVDSFIIDLTEEMEND